jgi:hypothetical protein
MTKAEMVKAVANDPGRITELRATLEAVKLAYQAGDRWRLKSALRIYKAEHVKTYGRYLDAVVIIKGEQ